MLNPRLNSRIRQEYLDMDYIHKLNDEEKAFLNKVLAEEIGASFQNDGTDFIPATGPADEPSPRKRIYDANNHRNVDQYGIIKAKVANTKLLNFEDRINMIEEELSRGVNVSSMENAYLDYIDGKQVEVMMNEYEAAMAVFISPEEPARFLEVLPLTPESPQKS